MRKGNINTYERKAHNLQVLGRLCLTIPIFCILCCVPIFAADIDFSPMVEMLYGVMKAIGVIVAIFGVITFIKGFASDQPESKVQAGMILAAGLLLYNAQAIIEAMGLSL